MVFSFNFPDSKYTEYVGKKVRIVFVDGDVLEGKVLGFTSALDNDEGVASIEFSCEQFLYSCVSAFENEIKSIDLI